MSSRNPAQNESEFSVRSGDVRLRCHDFGGRGAPYLLIHGIAGAAVEWRETAAWLVAFGRPIAFDQRGHGASDRTPGRYSRDAYVGDVIAVLEQLGEPAVVIGQSMGGTNAYLAASRRPELFRALVVVEAGTSPDPKAPDDVRSWLEAWPVPFRSLRAARRYFDSIGVSPVWAATLARHPDGYRPRFEIDDMVASIECDADTDYAEEWSQIRCPTLVVAGSRSGWPTDEPRRMAHAIPHGSFTLVEDAGHDVHLDAPERFREAVETFVS
jgi:pimeloyl-ACP methyl ester carboxylesterase